MAKSETRLRPTPRLFNSAVFGVFFTVAIFLTGLGAFFALSGNEGQASKALNILRLNLVLIAGLGISLFLRLRRVLTTSGDGQSAPHLHRRFVFIFSLGAVVPAILVGLFFAVLMTRNFNDIFGPNVRQTLETSRELSSAYLKDEIDEIGQGIYDIAEDLNREESLLSNRITYKVFMINQAVYREFPSVYVIDGEGRILSQAEGPTAPPYVLPSQETFDLALDGSVTFTTRAEIDFLMALYKLENYENAYLYTGRYIRAGVLNNIENAEQVQAALTNYSGDFNDLNRVFFLTYIEVALIIFFAAIWLGLMLANRIVSPLGQMVNAAEKVRSGDLTTRVNVTGVWDEIGDLANAFNRMTRQLKTQREDLVLEHDISEQRRKFSEAVLSGVSAGVIGLSPEGRITVINRSAEKLLGIRSADAVGIPLANILPEFTSAFKTAIDSIDHGAEDQINLDTSAGTRNLDIRVSAYKDERTDTGWVVTFDDMTRLVAAQRHSAWRDVARRIAHEIKNPLTPIQLSAERLERKYKNEITTDPNVFTRCTQTIIRQVENLGRMVDEFSAFARMPTPALNNVNLEIFMSDILFAQRVAYPDLNFVYDNQSDKTLEILCDERLISQALTNIYKNAGESITRRIDQTGQDEQDGQIKTIVKAEDDHILIDVIDNGLGWPIADKEALLEPYMTTRKEGTGLGMAIVKRIAEDHGGAFILFDRPDGTQGACVRLQLPISEPSGSSQSKNEKPRLKEHEGENI
ncbi:MAG: PAS domain-containing sensor histidine kinase [Acidimicrobiales bacterium]|nr:PAS domain-containing sensor histidine kinase [Hyphomonadaceae bacterium]RZV42770.1 MAG: PAS domain-containing sensor histidine kinase [Acidimicrobiales bacterium]